MFSEKSGPIINLLDCYEPGRVEFSQSRMSLYDGAQKKRLKSLKTIKFLKKGAQKILPKV